ncbi:protein kinase domain-containing protein [Actinoalloteichus caeruleus]
MENVSVATTDSEDPATPRVIAGRYRLRRVSGKGATGIVWVAYDEFLRRQVALKEVLLPQGVPAPEADAMRERTMREARANAVLSHPNVVTLYDVVRHEGEPFVVMELVLAHSLAAVLRHHGPINEQQAAVVGDAIAAALEAAHRAGITHRDVKPGNVLVNQDGWTKLTDFGIARNVTESTLTATGLLLGTPSYIAPEVATGRGVSPAADLWGLGATLYAAMEGRPPYDAGGDPLATVTEVVHGPVPQASRGGTIAEIISGLMVKAPAKRMPLAEVRRRLAPLLPKSGVNVFEDVHMPDPSAAEPPSTGTRGAGGTRSGTRGAGGTRSGTRGGAGTRAQASRRPPTATGAASLNPPTAGATGGWSPGGRRPGGRRPTAQSTGALGAHTGALGGLGADDDSSPIRAIDDSAPLAADPGPLPFPVRDTGTQPAVEETSPPAPLAAEPGPLPFAPPPSSGGPGATSDDRGGRPPAPSDTAGSRPGRRTGAPRIGRGGMMLAVPLFLVAALVGFALVRTVAGESVLPTEVAGAPAPGQGVGSPTLDLASDRAVGADTEPTEGRFELMLPEGWGRFQEQRQYPELPDSSITRYVSEDGSSTVAVEWFADYFQEHSVDDYVSRLPELTAGSGGQFVPGLDVPAETDREQAGPEPARELTYRLVDSGLLRESAGAEQRRTVYVRLLPRDDDLWLVSVSVDTRSETVGRTELFNQIAPSFTTLA